MTCREKLAMEHPDCVGPEFEVGCCGCPSHYGYLEDRNDCEHSDCSACWDREIPDTAKNAAERMAARLKSAVDTPDEVSTQCGDSQVTILQNGRTILDSGNRTEFDTGAVRDMREGKGRCDLMPLHVVSKHLEDAILYNIAQFQKHNDVDCLYQCLGIFSKNWDDGKTKHTRREITNQRLASMYLEVAKHFEEGAKKYGENNWQKGIPVHCYIDSAVRHYLKWLRGDKDEPHDRAFVWNLMCCIWEVDYRPKEETE